MSRVAAAIADRHSKCVNVDLLNMAFSRLGKVQYLGGVILPPELQELRAGLWRERRVGRGPEPRRVRRVWQPA